MASKHLILIGGGGHCKSSIDVIESTTEWIIDGIVDEEEKIGNSVLGYRIIGTDLILDELIADDFYFLVTIGHITNNFSRKRIFDLLISKSARVATIESPLASISKYSTIGKGTMVHHFSIINSDVNVGTNCIVNSGAIIEHDCSVGNNCHISTGATLNGSVVVGSNSFIGSGAIINNNCMIGEGVVIGSGGVVINNINEPGVYVGVPVVKIK